MSALHTILGTIVPVLTKSSGLHAEAIHRQAAELPTILLAVIGAAAILAYYGVRELLKAVREVSRNSDCGIEPFADDEHRTF